MKSFPFYALVLTGIILLVFFSGYTNDPQTQSTKESNTLPQIVKGVKISVGVHFGGETLPLDNFDVKERLDRELMVNSYWHSATLQHLKLANRYFPIIEPILKKNGVPDDFKYLAVAESSLRNAVSPAGAKGVWQFMPGTARDYGLIVNNEVDERYHIEKSTEAACAYIKKAKAQFGTWTLAAASYNMGVPRLKKILEKQKERSYYNLEINEETARYVFRIVAIKEILSSPRDYGFYLDPDEYYAPLNQYSVLVVDDAVENWADFAKKYGTTYRMLKLYNPWLRTSSLTNKAKKKYTVRIPKKS